MSAGGGVGTRIHVKGTAQRTATRGRPEIRGGGEDIRIVDHTILQKDAVHLGRRERSRRRMGGRGAQ